MTQIIRLRSFAVLNTDHDRTACRNAWLHPSRLGFMSSLDRHCLRPLTLAVLSAIACIVAGTSRSVASSRSIEVDGIDAARLHGEYNLLGRKIGIGQVEIGRPAVFGLDKIPADRATNPAGVFLGEHRAGSEIGLDGHAQGVASVMVSHLKARMGVAPGAQLYSGVAVFEEGSSRQARECLAAQTVAQQNSNDVRSINFSFGEPLSLDSRRREAVLDGNALLTLCIDWSANAHNVLYVIAGNQGYGGISIPTDQFNGMTIAASRPFDGIYSRMDTSSLGGAFDGAFSNLVGQETNTNGRRLISLLAPGRDVSLVNAEGMVYESTGTSFAAPHVTATVALLQEYGDRQIAAGRWSVDARRHEVMRAVLLNSADKIADRGDGLALGMTRNVQDKWGRLWTESTAYRDRAVPLQDDIGAGHLNAYRAYQQFAPGPSAAGSEAGTIGWNYGAIGAHQTPETVQDYPIADPLQAGSFFSATLTWTRPVDLNDTNGNGLFDEGEDFTGHALDDLDMYLLPINSDRLEDAVWSSESKIDSVEHLFHTIPTTGRYKLRVVLAQHHNPKAVAYALAWWGVAATESR